jgi:transcriptional regulator with XRE-family HTH domain
MQVKFAERGFIMDKESGFHGYDSVFAERLRKIMNEQRKTQKEVADVLGITRQAISQYLDGAVQPNAEKLYKLSKYFQVSCDWLIGLSEVSVPDTTIRAVHDITGLSEYSIIRLAGIEQLTIDENEKIKLSKEKMQKFVDDRSTKIPIIDALIGNKEVWAEITDAVILYYKYKKSEEKVEIDDVVIELSTLTEIHLRRAENALRKLITTTNWGTRFKTEKERQGG